jgi:hypothetical protein
VCLLLQKYVFQRAPLYVGRGAVCVSVCASAVNVRAGGRSGWAGSWHVYEMLFLALQSVNTGVAPCWAVTVLASYIDVHTLCSCA